MSETTNAVFVHPDDNVVTVTEDVSDAGEVRWSGGRLMARTAVPYGHKVALTDIAAGEPVIKYGQRIGMAAESIAAGAHVHTHNLSKEEW